MGLFAFWLLPLSPSRSSLDRLAAKQLGHQHFSAYLLAMLG